MDDYATSQIRSLMERGPSPGEDFYRLKVTGMGETNWVNVTHDELLIIAHILNPAWMHYARRLVRDALEGDSNDAEHDALVECAHALNINYRLES